MRYLICALLVLTAAPAKAEVWCVHDFGATQRACVFISLKDCVAATSVVGGRCEREWTVRIRPDPPSKPVTPAAPPSKSVESR